MFGEEIARVIFKPPEEFIIHESIRYKLEDFIKLLCIGIQRALLKRVFKRPQGGDAHL
jgi:hypothetical protein